MVPMSAFDKTATINYGRYEQALKTVRERCRHPHKNAG